MDECQGTPWNEEFDGTNSPERLVAIWSREDPLFLVHRRHGVNPPYIICKCGVIMILKGWCFLLIDCTSVQYLTVFSLANYVFVHTDSICVS